jgi:proteasome beta subunit
VDFTGDVSVPHATTCVALRFADGVVMAGDRRATSGNLISHRGMEKVVQADLHSGVAIAGAAGPAMEMVKLFQLQLEHYEKVEGSALSLEGKANQLSMMVRGNLPAAMQGMVVVPIFAGYDLRRATAGCSPTTSPAAATRSTTTWPPARACSTPARSSRSGGATASIALRGGRLACRALWEAADADSATGGPDLLRGIYPVVATITADGFAPGRRRTGRRVRRIASRRCGR